MLLVCPSKHTIFLDTHGESFSDSFSGTIHLGGEVELSSLHVSLVQTILLDTERHPTSENSIHEQRHPKKRFQRHKPKKQQRNASLERTSFTTELFHYNLSTSPTSNQARDHEFSLSIPCDVPASIGRPSFSITYDLIASGTTTSGRNLTTRQTLHVTRLKIPDPHEVFRYIRTFPETKLRAEFILYPELSSSHGHRCGKHISAQLLLRDVATPGPRHGEMTVVIAKEVTWRVDEIESWNTQQTQDRPVTRQKRIIATGGLKGRWAATRANAGHTGSADMAIPIPFDIAIDSSADALTDFTSEHSRLAPFLAVKHRLTMTIVTGSETINRETGSLVDKRDTVRVLGATVPIPVYEYVEGSMVSERLEASDTVLPQYYGCSGSPPGYSN